MLPFKFQNNPPFSKKEPPPQVLIFSSIICAVKNRMLWLFSQKAKNRQRNLDKHGILNSSAINRERELAHWLDVHYKWFDLKRTLAVQYIMPASWISWLSAADSPRRQRRPTIFYFSPFCYILCQLNIGGAEMVWAHIGYRLTLDRLFYMFLSFLLLLSDHSAFRMRTDALSLTYHQMPSFRSHLHKHKNRHITHYFYILLQHIQCFFSTCSKRFLLRNQKC